MKINIKNILLLIITFIFLYCVFVNIDLKDLIENFKNFDLKYALLLICSISVSLSFRALSYKFLISKTIKKVSFIELVLLCITGAALNIFMPARAGDFFRAYFTGYKYNVSKVKLLGTVLFERVLDVVVIFIFLCIGILKYHNSVLARYLCLFAGITIFAGLLFVIVTYKFNQTDKICNYIILKSDFLPFKELIKKGIIFCKNFCNSLFNGFEIIDSPKKLVCALFSSVGIWIFECINFLIIINGFGYHIHWSVVIFIVSFVALACMIPSASIYIGPYQLAIISAFAMYNIPKEPALAMALTEQSIVTIFTLFVAVIFLIKNNISFVEIKKTLK